MQTEVRSQDVVGVFASISIHNKTGREIAWNYFKANQKAFIKMYQSGPLVWRLVKNLTENFATEERCQEIGAFFDANPMPSADRTIRQSLESIKANADWLSRDSQIIRSYLSHSV